MDHVMMNEFTLLERLSAWRLESVCIRCVFDGFTCSIVKACSVYVLTLNLWCA